MGSLSLEKYGENDEKKICKYFKSARKTSRVCVPRKKNCWEEEFWVKIYSILWARYEHFTMNSLKEKHSPTNSNWGKARRFVLFCMKIFNKYFLWMLFLFSCVWKAQKTMSFISLLQYRLSQFSCSVHTPQIIKYLNRTCWKLQEEEVKKNEKWNLHALLSFLALLKNRSLISFFYTQ